MAINDKDILDLVAADTILHQDLQSNWQQKLIGMDDPKNWSILSQYNPVHSSGYDDWDFYIGEYYNMRAIVSFKPDDHEDEGMYFILDDMTWEAYSGGKTGKL